MTRPKKSTVSRRLNAKLNPGRPKKRPTEDFNQLGSKYVEVERIVDEDNNDGYDDSDRENDDDDYDNFYEFKEIVSIENCEDEEYEEFEDDEEGIRCDLNHMWIQWKAEANIGGNFGIRQGSGTSRSTHYRCQKKKYQILLSSKSCQRIDHFFPIISSTPREEADAADAADDSDEDEDDLTDCELTALCEGKSGDNSFAKITEMSSRKKHME